MWQPIALREKTPCQYSLLKGILPSHHYTMYTNRWLRLLAVSVLLLLCCDAAVCWMRNFAKGFAIYGSRFQQGKQGNSLYPLLFMPPSAGSTAGQGGPFYLGNGAFDPGFDYTASSMSSIIRCAATALLLCQSAVAFVSLPACSRRTGDAALRPTPAKPCSRRWDKWDKSYRLAPTPAAEGGGSSGSEGKRKPPRAVLQRPWDVEVDLYGERRVITVQPGDSILEAAEMSGMNLSYECRRGNCTSCAAKVREGSSGQFENRADRPSDDGAPEGFVLTCSTYPVGPGVKLELSANAEMWNAYCAQLEDMDTKDLLRQTSAALMRDYRVNHPEVFRAEVERQFESSQDNNSG